MCKLPSRKLLATLVSAALFVPQAGFALGLGEIEVNSSLNQKLNADIQLLSATADDTETLIIKLASRKEFTRAGIDRPYMLNDLRFKAEVVNNVPYIKVSSGHPIREPFLNFLIEVDWPNGHMLREYTVLLDPPVFMTQSADTAATQDNVAFRPTSQPATEKVTPVRTSSPTVTSSAPVSRPQPVAAPAAETKESPAFTSAPVVQKKTPVNKPSGSYRIKSGDTAWKLAEAMRPDNGVTIPQMMFALLRTNPESFIQGNINGIKRGYILRMPSADQIAAIDQAEARAMVREHWALWRQYQQARASGEPASAMQSDTSTTTAASGGNSALESSSDARLEIVAPEGQGSSIAGVKDPSSMTVSELREALSLARERIETERVEKEALQQRINTLQQQVDGRQGLLSVEDEELSRVQSLNQPTNVADEAIPEDSEIQDVVTDSELTDSASGLESDETSATADSEIKETADEEVGGTEDALFADELSEPAAAETATAPQPVTTPAAPVEQPVKRSATDPLSQILNDPVLLAAAGGGLLLLAAFIGIMIRRRKATGSAVESGFDNLDVLSGAKEKSSGATQQVDEAESLSAEDKKETAASEVSTDAAETKTAATGNEPHDDVIAEADVYLAYGIYQQAEDILKQAIADDPERIQYQVKLAETYFTGKNADAFVELATQIRQKVDDDSVEWKKVMVMGQELCADNALFQGAVESEEVAAPVHDVPSMDFELGDAEIEEQTVSAAETTIDELSDTAEATSHAEDIAKTEIHMEPEEEIEFDLSDTGAIEEPAATAETAAEEDEFLLDIEDSELDVDVAEKTESVDATAEAEQELEPAEEISLDLDDSSEDEEIVLNLSDEMEVESRPDPEPLELPESLEINEPEAAANESPEEEEFDLSSLADVDETSTKLDLARAYLDMGDTEGTRGILEEVLLDGSDEQKQEANELMAKLN